VRGKYRDVILPMTVLRRLDAVLEPTKKAVIEMKAALDQAKITNQDQALRQAAGQAFYNTSQFTLRDLRARASQQQLRTDFEAYLDGFSPNVQEILECFEFRNQIPEIVASRRARNLDREIPRSRDQSQPGPGKERRRIDQASRSRQSRDGHDLRGAGAPLQRGEQRGGGRALDAARCRQADGAARAAAGR
jgi:hypothetical protein